MARACLALGDFDKEDSIEMTGEQRSTLSALMARGPWASGP